MPAPGRPWKAMTLRLSPEQEASITAIARVEHRPKSEVIRSAILNHIEQRKDDPDFRKRFAAEVIKNNKALKELLDG